MSADVEERLTVPRTEAAQRIQRQIERLEKIVERHPPAPRGLLSGELNARANDEVNRSFVRALIGFREFTDELLLRLSTTTRLRDMFHDVEHTGAIPVESASLKQFASELRFRLESIAEHLELYAEPIPEKPSVHQSDGIAIVPSAQGDVVHTLVNVAAAGFSPMPSSSVASRRVFIVHGHDDAMKESVARVIERLQLDAIVLHEQPNLGHAVIEKFEDYSDVRYAVVLMSPDDVGCVKGKEPEGLQLRARQNVIYELGFFAGKLGRGNVAVIYKEGIEMPSDYLGVLYLPYDAAGQWKLALAGELRSAGVEVDLNLLVR
jgi:predicted nucleotide-binding protein